MTGNAIADMLIAGYIERNADRASIARDLDYREFTKQNSASVINRVRVYFSI